jgi:hypothetical protein
MSRVSGTEEVWGGRGSEEERTERRLGCKGDQECKRVGESKNSKK